MEILLSPHDRRLRGLVNSSWIAIDRKSQQAETLGVRHKTNDIDCTCGELLDTYHLLTPVRGLVHTSTGSDLSDKDVQFIMERLNLKLSLSDRSSNSVAAANYLSPHPVPEIRQMAD